jgi:hypothetical protein
MKELKTLLGVYIAIIVLLVACTKVVQPPSPTIDLGVAATSTGIKYISQLGTTVTAEFQTTPGAKYSVQIVPFGSDQPIRTEGFTANDTLTQKIYNLSGLVKKDYDLIFIDISGKEVKFPLIIK